MTTLTLTDAQIEELERVFWLRYPSEACGLIVPVPKQGHTVLELPNRSLRPQNSYVMRGTDIRLELDEWFDENPDRLTEIIFWHTHPSGDERPSTADRTHRVQGAQNLIVTVPPNRELPLKLHWF